MTSLPLLSALLLGLGLLCLNAAAQEPSYSGQAEEIYAEKIQPLLATYCYDCHGDGMDKGGVQLDSPENLSALLGKEALWQDVALHIRAHTMPPENKKQPSLEERQAIEDWIHKEVFYTDCENIDPGPNKLRRLNRQEYDNSIRDIFGVDLQPARNLPPDNSGYGYDNIADLLSVSPRLFESYLDAAKKITAQLIRPEQDIEQKERAGIDLMGSDFRAARGRINHYDGGYLFVSESTLRRTLPISQPGRHELHLSLGSQSTQGINALVVVSIAGKEIGRNFVLNPIDQPRPYVFSFIAEEAQRDLPLEISFINPGFNKTGKRQLFMGSAQLYVANHGPSLFQAEMLSPTPPDNLAEQLVYLKPRLAQIGRRIYRRTLSKIELDQLLQLSQERLEQGQSITESFRVCLQSLLCSPHFLFREIPQHKSLSKEPKNVSEIELASRLSYFIWSSCPDQRLLSLAEQGQLRTNLVPELRRLLADPKSRALTENFAGQWLRLRDLDHLSKDPKTYPSFSRSLALSMKRETELLFESILQENRSIFDFLTAEETYLDEKLAKHYKIEGVTGDHFRPVSLTNTKRRGILGQGSILSVTSHSTRTSPVLRGKFILENLLDSPPPPAPQDVPEFNQDRAEGVSGTLRARFEQHRNDKACASCHKYLDPPGFALENFDIMGAWRDSDEGEVIDSSAELPNGANFTGLQGLIYYITQSQREAYTESLIRQLMTYALGRGIERSDRCSVEEIAKELKHDGYRMQTLFHAIIKSVPFQKRRH